MSVLARKAARNLEFRSFALAFSSLNEIDNWVRAHFRYREESEEILRTPEFMLNDVLNRIGYLEGDCDDVSMFYAAIFAALGIPAQFVAIRYNADNPNFEHVFVQAYDMALWRTFDATVAPHTNMRALEAMTMGV